MPRPIRHTQYFNQVKIQLTYMSKARQLQVKHQKRQITKRVRKFMIIFLR